MNLRKDHYRSVGLQSCSARRSPEAPCRGGGVGRCDVCRPRLTQPLPHRPPRPGGRPGKRMPPHRAPPGRPPPPALVGASARTHLPHGTTLFSRVPDSLVPHGDPQGGSKAPVSRPGGSGAPGNLRRRRRSPRPGTEGEKPPTQSLRTESLAISSSAGYARKQKKKAKRETTLSGGSLGSCVDEERS